MASTKKTHFEILRKPILTEKSATLGSTGNAVVFEVHSDANKLEIKAAVERLFDVKVKAVRTVNVPVKLRKGKKFLSQKIQTWKKAYITLQPGSNLNVIEGL